MGVIKLHPVQDLYYRAKVYLEMLKVIPACIVTKMHGTTTFCLLLVSHTQQIITSPPQLGSGEAPTAAASGCLSLFQWMAKSFVKAGRLTLIAILRIKCYLSHNYVSSRTLTGMLESVLFSLPSYPVNAFLQMLAML